jgi:prepilin-type N-terminal cleavage/methylation domain-containing protein
MEINKTKKGFTLIELLMVVALIAILSTMILIALDSGREKAELNRYIAYATQMHRLVADSVAAGQFDSGKKKIESDVYCLGDINYDCGEGDEMEVGDQIYKSLTYLTKFPETDQDNSNSPYDKERGVTVQYKPNDEKVVRIQMYLLKHDNNATFLSKTCKSMGWGVKGDSCYIDVKLHDRL